MAITGDFAGRRVVARAAFRGVVCAVFAALSLVSFAGCERPVDLGEGVLAVVDGERLSVDDFLSVNGGKAPETEEERLDALNDIINYKLVSRLAHREGGLAGSDTMSRVRQAEADILPGILARDIAAGITVDDDEVEMQRPAGLSPMLITTMFVARTSDIADQAHEEISKGASFDEAAKAHPRNYPDAVKKNRAIELDDDLYPIGVRAALNRLAPGELSPVIKLEIGYGIFRLEDRVSPEQKWERMKPNVARRIREEKLKRATDEILDELYSQSDVRIEEVPGGYRATVDGTVITHEGFLSTQAGDDVHKPHTGMTADTVRRGMERAVRNLLLVKEAKRRGLDKTPGYRSTMRLVTEKIIAEEYLDKIGGDVAVSQDEIRDYYEKNKEKFASKELAKVSRILLDDEQTAEEVQETLRSGGNFAELALKYSRDDNSSDKGGDVGWVQTSGLKEPLREALYGLEVGEFSGVLKSDYGYEVLMVTERMPSAVPELSVLEPTIRKRVALIKRSDAVVEIYDRLHKEADVKINMDLLNSL